MGTLIDLSNYDTLLTESSATRGGSPPGSSDGNIFFDTTNGLIELITAEELSTVRLPTGVKTGIIQCAVTASSKTFTRTGGNFTSDGFVSGNTIRTYGFANSGNNVNFMVIDTVGTDTMTITTDPGLVDESGQIDVRIVEFGASLVANPMANQEGIFIGAVYAFERQQRRVNEFLRQFDFYGKGTYKYAGAYEMVNGRLFATTGSSTADDRKKLRGSGWLERDTNGDVTATYFGVRSLGNIDAGSQPYYQLDVADAKTDFDKPGSIDEAIAVADPADYLTVKVRTYGNTYDEKSLVDSAISEMSGFSAGFALGESPHLTTIPATYPLSEVYGVGQQSPWTGMTLEKLASPQSEGGGGVFKEGAGDFTWILHNTVPGSLDQCVAFLDALAQTDDDIDSGSETVTNGLRVSTWYTYNAAGQVVTRSGAVDGKGLFIEDLPIGDQQRIVFTSDGEGGTRTYPYTISFNIAVGAYAAADPNGWYHVWETAGYGAPGAVTVLDVNGEEMKGSTYSVPGNIVALGYNSTDGEVDVTVEVEGDGIATQAVTAGTIKVGATDAVQTIVCSPGQETNV